MRYSRRCVFGCATKGIIHNFPHPKNRTRQFQSWVELVGSSLQGLSAEYIYRTKKVCDAHFTNKDRNRNNRINSIAIPSVNLPAIDNSVDAMRQNVQGCSIGLPRYDLECGWSVPRPKEDDLTEPEDLLSAHAANDIQASELDKIPVAVKIEHEEDNARGQGPELERLHEQSVVDDLMFSEQKVEFVMKTEDELNEKIMVKEEMDIEPTVLQEKTTSQAKFHDSETCLDSDPSISSGVSTTPTPLSRMHSLHSQSTLEMKVETDKCEEDSDVLSNVSYVPNMTTTCASNLSIHMRTYTRKKPYKCGQCDYSASCVNNLTLHMRTHKAAKQYQYEQCQFGAHSLSDLKIHMYTRTNEKPYKCEQCEYGTQWPSHLKLHMRTHTGEKPYKCVQCDYSASSASNLTMHMRTHTGDKQYQCEQCQFSAHLLGDLKRQRHMRTHTGEKHFKCELCEYSARRLSHLKTLMGTDTV